MLQTEFIADSELAIAVVAFLFVLFLAYYKDRREKKKKARNL